jgi:hypothetical protein
MVSPLVLCRLKTPVAPARKGTPPGFCFTAVGDERTFKPCIAYGYLPTYEPVRAHASISSSNSGRNNAAT